MFIFQLFVACASGKVNGSKFPVKWCTDLTSWCLDFSLSLAFIMLKVNICILYAGWDVRGSSLNYCTCPGLNGILFPLCSLRPWFIGYMILWEHLCLLQQRLYAIWNTLIATGAAGSGHLLKVRQLLAESMHSIPKVRGNTWAGVKGIYSLRGRTA